MMSTQDEIRIVCRREDRREASKTALFSSFSTSIWALGVGGDLAVALDRVGMMAVEGHCSIGWQAL